MTEGDFRHIYVVMEQEEGNLLRVSLEMLAEARRLLDEFNKKYSSKEKVVAVLLGENIKQITDSLISHGADVVVYADNPELKHVRNTIHTKVISQIALDKEVAAQIEPEYATQFKRPRYMFFAADSIGRHLSATAMAQLESGLASEINQLVIGDIQMTHQSKNGGKPITNEKTVQM